MKNFVIISLLIIIIIGLINNLLSEKIILEKIEYAYFEGQRDALENDIRIKRYSDSCWIWIKSPWDNGKQPIYNPSIGCL
jgi:hypothetical protein